jgi:hypothetical protein
MMVSADERPEHLERFAVELALKIAVSPCYSLTSTVPMQVQTASVKRRPLSRHNSPVERVHVILLFALNCGRCSLVGAWGDAKRLAPQHIFRIY